MKRTHWKIAARGLWAASLLLAVCAQSVMASTLAVCPISNCQYSTIDDAVRAAQAGDTIQLGSAVYSVNLNITKNVSLQGQGETETILDGRQLDTVITINTGVVATLTGMTVRNGDSSDGSSGGIDNSGDLTLDRCKVTDNAGNEAGGIRNLGKLTVRQSTVANNSARLVSGASEIFNNNFAQIENSTLSSNTDYQVLVLNEPPATLNVTNSTISYELPHGKPLINHGTLGMYGATISYGPLTMMAGQLSIGNTILGSASGHPACDLGENKSFVLSMGHNVSSDTSCMLSDPSDKQGVGDMHLGPLQVNAPGTTASHALLPGSPAIDAVPMLTASVCAGGLLPSNDQRGVPRPQGSACDAGAYELRTPTAGDDHYVAIQGQGLIFPQPGILANDASPDGLTLHLDKASDVQYGLFFSVTTSGLVQYVPQPGFTGRDSFTYSVSDGVHVSNTATVTIDVQAANHPPIAQDDRYTVYADHQLNVTVSKGVLANDSDPDGNALRSILVTPPSHGSLTLNEDGSYQYAPESGYTGSDSFTYQSSDNQALSNAATVSLTVNSYRSTLTIVEDAQPDDPINFQFGGDLGSFILDNPATDDGDAFEVSKTFELAPGTYLVAQLQRAGWLTGNISCDLVGNSIADIAKNQIQVTLAAGDNITCTFANQLPGQLIAYVYADRNGNHRRDVRELWVAGQTLLLSTNPYEQPKSKISTTKGSAVFSNLRPNSYTICESPSADWIVTTPPSPDLQYGLACFPVHIAPGKKTVVRFGNTRSQ